MNFTDGVTLLALCEKKDIRISDAMIDREEWISKKDRKEIFAQMRHSYDIMKKSAVKALEQPHHSIGGLIGGEAQKLTAHRQKRAPVCGEIISKAASYAMSVMEVNTSMGLIVAAPTAGSSGVIPGVFLAIQEQYHFTDDEMVQALFNAGAIGYIFTRNATVSGADGGCQAEIGVACAMAASAVVELMGGTPNQCLDAASTAISNILGLVCDPVAGLVEEPCQKRNALGVSNALVSAELILAGICSVIPFDEMVQAMYRVGRAMPFELRETALGGVAATPTACALCQKIYQ